MLNVLVLACGDSERFVGYSTPKQFLKFNLPQQPVRQMWENVLAYLTTPSQVWITVRFDHRRFWERTVQFAKTYSLMMATTRGQADTLCNAVHRVPMDDLLVVNCDNGFAPGVLDQLVDQGRAAQKVACLTFQPPAGLLDRWSYVDSHPFFRKAVEKAQIGTHALAGAYYFPSREDLEAALSDQQLDGDEPYVSQTLSALDGRKLSVEMRYEDFYDWGTPEALNKFMGYQK